MKKFSLLFVFCFLIKGYLFGQCAPYEQSIPLAPSNTINYWDWRNEDLSSRDGLLDNTGAYKFWYRLNGTRTLFLNTSPFIATQQINTGGFVFDQDYSPEDGWELVYRHFGETLSEPDAYYTATPAFALYNRRSGLLRIFIMPTYNPTAQTASIELWFNNLDEAKKSAILSFGTDYPAAIEKFDNNISMNSLNNKGIACNAPDCDTWYYGDFYLAYDPCICRNFSPPRFESPRTHATFF